MKAVGKVAVAFRELFIRCLGRLPLPELASAAGDSSESHRFEPIGDRKLGTLPVTRQSLPGAALDELQPFGFGKERPESASGR